MARTKRQTRQGIVIFALEWLILFLAVSLATIAERSLVFNIVSITALSFLGTYLILKTKKLGVSTDMASLNNLGNPLMTRLLKVAPGTYNHSLIVAQLASSCGKAISINSELLQLGAYYHDIGKIMNPSIFVENGKNTGSEHNLEKKIIAHVKNGLKIANEYFLPVEICDLIIQHHGNSRVESFKESGFHYPGPKPQSKIAGIIMLSDCVEASVRSQKNPNEITIRKIIDTQVKKKQDSGQLSESGLSEDEIGKIKQDFALTISNIYHKRNKQ
jgi:putative nucleotidyltransferase with HDIG domain